MIINPVKKKPKQDTQDRMIEFDPHPHPHPHPIIIPIPISTPQVPKKEKSYPKTIQSRPKEKQNLQNGNTHPLVASQQCSVFVGSIPLWVPPF
jgi:hypothetical protein